MLIVWYLGRAPFEGWAKYEVSPALCVCVHLGDEQRDDFLSAASDNIAALRGWASRDFCRVGKGGG